MVQGMVHVLHHAQLESSRRLNQSYMRAILTQGSEP